MNAGSAIFITALAAAFLPGPDMTGWAAPAAPTHDAAAGARLAAHLRSLTPSEAVEFRGTLRISRPQTQPQELPITSRIVLGTDDWTTSYTVNAGAVSEILSIRHRRAGTNEYTWKRGGQVSQLTGDAATNRFAGSDFALMDLGLEFLHWPKQILVTREMRKGRGCDVLESRPGRAGLYSRVISWIDQETSGLLMAEAYDTSGKLLKEFEVKGFKKVAGQWQVREMEIRNRQAKTSTRLQFQFDGQ